MLICLVGVIIRLRVLGADRNRIGLLSFLDGAFCGSNRLKRTLIPFHQFKQRYVFLPKFVTDLPFDC